MKSRALLCVAALWAAAEGRASAVPAVQVALIETSSSPAPPRPHLRRALAETGCAAYTAASCIVGHSTCALQLCGFAYVNGTTVAWHDQAPHACVDYTAATQTCSNSTPACPVGTQVIYPVVGGNSYTVNKECATGATPTTSPTQPPTKPAPAPAPGPAPAPTGSSAGTIAVTIVILLVVFFGIAGAAVGGVLIYIKVILPKQGAGKESLLAGGAAAPRKRRKKKPKNKGTNDPFGGRVDSDPYASSGGGGGGGSDSGSDESDGGATFKAKKKKQVKRDKGSPFDL